MPTRIELLPLTTFTINPHTSITQDTQLIKYVRVEQFVSGLVELRAQARTLASTQQMGLVLQPISRAEDEPAGIFTTATGEIAAMVTASVPTALPSLVIAQLTAPVPAYFRLLLRGIQSAGGGSMSLTCSASLTLRES